MSEENKETQTDTPAVADGGTDNQPQIDVASVLSQVQELSSKLDEVNQENERLKHHNEKVITEKREIKEKYSGLDEAKYKEYLAFQELRNKNEIVELAANGDIGELERRFTANQSEAFQRELMDRDEQISAFRAKNAEFESQIAEQEDRFTSLQKRQYLKDIVSSDASFKGNKPDANFDYFGQLEQIYSSQLHFDKTDGKAYAIGANGQHLYDANGEKVLFDTHIEREKAKGSPFFEGGSGTGIKSGPGGIPDVPISRMSPAEKTAYRKDVGEKEFMRVLTKQIQEGK